MKLGGGGGWDGGQRRSDRAAKTKRQRRIGGGRRRGRGRRERREEDKVGLLGCFVGPVLGLCASCFLWFFHGCRQHLHSDYALLCAMQKASALLNIGSEISYIENNNPHIIQLSRLHSMLHFCIFH